MKIKEKRKEWKVSYKNRREVLIFVQEMKKKYGISEIVTTTIGDEEIAWIPKSYNISREEITEVANSVADLILLTE